MKILDHILVPNYCFMNIDRQLQTQGKTLNKAWKSQKYYEELS